VTIAGVELLHRIRKGQFNLSGCAWQAKPRPQSGTWCSPHEWRTAQTRTGSGAKFPRGRAISRFGGVSIQ
jgi:hypothetical protein